VAGAGGFGFSIDAPLSGGTGLETLSSIAVKYLDFAGQVGQNF
jgi:hypothetical protein